MPSAMGGAREEPWDEERKRRNVSCGVVSLIINTCILCMCVKSVLCLFAYTIGVLF